MTGLADQQQDDFLTAEEAALRLTQLSAADRQRLKQISEYLTRSTDEAKDLRQDAYMRTVEGSRRCQRDQNMVGFLAAAMKSIVHSRRKAAARLQPHKDALEREPESVCTTPVDPLTLLLKEENEFQVDMGKLKLFGDDAVAMTLVEGIMEGFQGAELCELAGITPQELASKRKLIKRRLDAALKRSKR